MHIHSAGIDQRFLFDTLKKEMTGVPAGKIEDMPLQRVAGVLAVRPSTGRTQVQGRKSLSFIDSINTAPFHDRTPKQRSNVKDLIRKKENQKVSNRQCSYLKHSCTCVLLAN